MASVALATLIRLPPSRRGYVSYKRKLFLDSGLGLLMSGAKRLCCNLVRLLVCSRCSRGLVQWFAARPYSDADEELRRAHFLELASHVLMNALVHGLMLADILPAQILQFYGGCVVGFTLHTLIHASKAFLFELAITLTTRANAKVGESEVCKWEKVGGLP